MKYQFFYCLIGLCLLAPVTKAQQVVKNTGDVTGVSVKESSIDIRTENAFINISVYSPNIVRVRMDQQQLGSDFSYAVIAKPRPGNVKISQDDVNLQILTESLKVVIQKKPYSITFHTLSGEVINQDETGLTTSWIGTEVTTYKKMQEGERFLGLGEKTGNLDRTGNAYVNWNSDVFGYSTSQDPLYSTIPFYIGIHHGLNYGVFFDNSYRSTFNFGASNNRFSSFGALGGEMNYYFIYHANMPGIIKSYTDLTGRMHMPPLWSLGYQQNRYSYYPDTEVLRIAQTLREKHIPADGITLDIHYMDAYKLFTWNKERFPDPAAMVRKLKDMGFKTTLIVDPGIKVEAGYPAYESGKKEDVFIKYSDGQYYTGQVWPGWCHFPDFTGEKGRDWWKEQMKRFVNEGICGFWNDMNEIATWGQTMPNNVLFDFEGKKTTHQQAHNIYGLNMIKASYEGTRAAMKTRPFILTRAGYAGLQRYAALWTGDNRAEDDHMLLGIRLMNSLGMSGVSFTGMDVGGFTGNPSVGLYTRWMQIGAFIPYFRNHTGVNTKSSEPWAYGEESLEVNRNYINLRYRLLPYLYSSMYESTQDGMPVMRSLAIDQPHESKIYDTRYQNEYEYGHAFLIMPFESGKDYGSVYFPEGTWYNFYTDAPENGDTEKIIPLNYHQLPVYVKGSSIIPMQSLIQNTAEQPTDTLVVHVYKGTEANTFVYYEDDGNTYDYENGVFYKREIKYDPAADEIKFGTVSGEYSSNFKHVALVLHGFDQSLDGINVDGKKMKLAPQQIAFLNPISKFDPTGGFNVAPHCQVKVVVFDNLNKEIVVSQL